MFGIFWGGLGDLFGRLFYVVFERFLESVREGFWGLTDIYKKHISNNMYTPIHL